MNQRIRQIQIINGLLKCVSAPGHRQEPPSLGYSHEAAGIIVIYMPDDHCGPDNDIIQAAMNYMIFAFNQFPVARRIREQRRIMARNHDEFLDPCSLQERQYQMRNRNWRDDDDVIKRLHPAADFVWPHMEKVELLDS